tara:strand:+ start:460 stop:801 length:342 start_codon:yes stop_codon:yes gene_type:complete
MDEGIVSFQEWMKLDLRVGKIVNVEDIENADKLYKLEVDLGEEIGKRTLAAGLKKHYSKDELKGKKAVFFVNLEPKEMRGVKSEGMILAAVNEDESKIKILEVDDIEVGSKIR